MSNSGWCTYGFSAVGKAKCRVYQGGVCDTDVDECKSQPCKNGATCTDSTSKKSSSNGVLVGAYACSCASGFSGTNCATDVNECSKNPCKNGATCSESSKSTLAKTPNAFSCTCLPGFSGKTCDVDVNECASSPCKNGATCSDSKTEKSIPVNTYSCSCASGYANGLCSYTYLPAFAQQCNVALGGDCSVDVDECSSNPCGLSGECAESQTTTPFPVIAITKYRATPLNSREANKYNVKTLGKHTSSKAYSIGFPFLWFNKSYTSVYVSTGNSPAFAPKVSESICLGI